MSELSDSPRIYNISFTAFIATATYYGYHTFASPPRSSKKFNPATGQDSLQRFGLVLFLHNYRFFVCLAGVSHAILSAFGPPYSLQICSSPQTLTPWLFQWNNYTIFATACMILGGALRAEAYNQLGSNYTFHLAIPSGLVTGGLYKHMQHPGYTGGLVCTLGILLLFGRFDGGVGCYMPAYLRTLASVVHITFVTLVMVFVVKVRVGEEEAMLRRTFGEEWEQYHRNTRRLVPCLL